MANYKKCKLKADALPHYVRRGKVIAGEEFVTDEKHAQELYEVGAVDILGDASEADLSPVERIVAVGEAPTGDKPADKDTAPKSDSKAK